MGCTASQNGGSEEEISRSKTIEKNLRADQKKFDNEVRLLLLGAGQSGKSTMAKQMKLIYLGGFSDAERGAFAEIVHGNILTALYDLLAGVQQSKLSLQPENEVFFCFVLFSL